MCIISGICTFRMMDSSIAYQDKSAIRFYQGSHYSQKFDVDKAHKILSSIPSDKSVSATTSILPHLAFRDSIYCFPLVNNAEYIVYSSELNFYPITKEQAIAKIDSLVNLKKYSYIDSIPGFYLLSKQKD